MFNTIIARPIFNLLALIYALIPGHNLGLAIIIFTIIIRLLLWPLVKRQLHQAKLMRQIQPELKRIARETKGDKQKQAMLQMELYKEKGISPVRSIGVVILQLPILYGLYAGLRLVIKDPHQMVNFAYPWLQHLPWLQTLSHNIKLFDNSLFGLVDLHRSALGGTAGVYWPALALVLGSAVVQYYQARQLTPTDKNARSLRTIMKEAGKGQSADQQEVSAAVSRITIFFLPAIIFLFTAGLPSALSLYWLVSGIVAYIQQSIILREDETELEQLADVPTKDVANIPEAEIVKESPTSSESAKPKKSKKKTSNAKSKKRRRR